MNKIRRYYEQKKCETNLTVREFVRIINQKLKQIPDKTSTVYITKASLNQWMNGKHKLTSYTVAAAIAEVIGCSAEDVFKTVENEVILNSVNKGE